MFNLLEATISPLKSNAKILEVAYELFLQAPESSHPTIDLHELSQKTGMSLLECRNAIVEANKQGRFPNCSLHS